MGHFGLNNYVPHTIAHEIGHILVGDGHPDEYPKKYGGLAPLPGTDHTQRLMASGPIRSGFRLVKGEWDQAEKSLVEKVDDPDRNR